MININRFQKSVFVALLTGMMITTVSCKDEEFSPLEEKVLVKEINLKVTPELPLLIGTDTIIKYTVGPEDAFDKRIVWKSTVPSVASVDDDGRISALQEGEAVISAMPAVGYTVTSTFIVKVVNEIFHITDISLTNETLEVFATSTLPLKWETTPKEPTYPGLTWESLTPEVAIVNEKGEVKGVAEGVARIKATATDDKHFSKVFEINVKPIVPIESMEFVNKSDKLALGETYIPVMNVYPQNATMSYIQWTSSKSDVVEIDDNGRFIAKAYGNTVIKAFADYGEGKSIECEMQITVSEGLMNDNFTFENIWKPFGSFVHKEFEWIQDEGLLRIFPGDDKQYKAVRIARDGGFGFNVTNYPILAFKVRFPKDVFKNSKNIEWYLDVWGSDSDANGKYSESVNSGNRAMAVIDNTDYQVFYADFKQKGLGKTNKFMPTSLTQYGTIELQFWKIWYNADEKGSIYVDWIKTFASEQELKDYLKSESK